MRTPIVVALCTATMVGGSAAHAAQYTVVQGADSTGAPIGAPGWQGLTDVPAGWFGIVAPAQAEGDSHAASLGLPSGVSPVSSTVTAWHAAPQGANHSQPQIVTSWGSWGWPFSGVSQAGGFAGSGGPVSGAAGTDTPRITLRCVPLDGIPGTCAAGTTFLISRLVLTLADPSDPSVIDAPPDDALLGSPPPSGWRTSADGTVRLRAQDGGSGVREVLVRDGLTVLARVAAHPQVASCADVDAAAGGVQFNDPAPCPTGPTDIAAAISLAALGDGEHELELGIADAAGNVTWRPATYTVRINAPGGALADPGTPCTNGSHDDAGVCVMRAPSSLAAPVLDGTPAPGATLTTDAGGWSDAVGASITYAWESCDADGSGCSPLSGHSADTLTVTAAMIGRRVRSVVTATTAGGSTSSRSTAAYVALPDGSGAGGAGGAGGVRDVVPGSGGSGGGGRALGAEDRAGLPVAASAPTTRVSVVNGRGVAGEAVLLDASLPAGARATPYGTTQAIRGRLRNRDGSPIAEAQIDVIVQEAIHGARGRIAGAVKTDEDGRFAYTAPVGGSRIVTVGYRRHLSDDAYLQAVSVPVRVAAGVSLLSDRAVTRNGSAIRFSGAVRGAPAGSEPPVELQVQLGRRWQPFATTTAHGGRFSYRYRFSRTARTTSYRFRAVVAPGSESWAVDAGTSPSRTVRVIGARASATMEVER